MSVKCLTWAWSQVVPNSARKLVLLALADHADDEGTCWPGLSGLAGKCSIPRRTLIRAIKDLAAAGLLTIEHRGGEGDGRGTNIYRLVLESKNQSAKCQSDTRLSATESLAKCQPDTRLSANLTPGKGPNAGGAKCQSDTRLSAKTGGAKCQSLAPKPSIEPSNKKQPSRERSADAPRARKTVALPLPADWHPSESVYAILESQGISREFASACLPEFALYWTESGDAKASWNATFLNNVKRLWDRKPKPAAPGGGRAPGTVYTPATRHAALSAANESALAQWLGGPPPSATTATLIPKEIAHEIH